MLNNICFYSRLNSPFFSLYSQSIGVEQRASCISHSVKVSYCRCGPTIIVKKALWRSLRPVAKLSRHFLTRSIPIRIYKHNEPDCEHPWQDLRYTLEIQWRHDKNFLEHYDDIATAVLFCAEVARFWKTVSNQYPVHFVYHSLFSQHFLWTSSLTMNAGLKTQIRGWLDLGFLMYRS